MKKYTIRVLFLAFATLFFVDSKTYAQYKFDETQILEFQKKEMNWGLHYYTNTDREELRTEKSRNYEELVTGAAKVRFQNRYWNFLEYKQESFDFSFETGPFWGNGNWIDSSYIKNSEADHKVAGLKTNASIAYTNRYFYNNRNYTIVQIGGWGSYDLYKQSSEGISVDSNNVVTTIDENKNKTKLRYGFQARGGWGIGRLNPVNNFMIADYLLLKYYKGRNFSQEEIVKLAHEIGNVKKQRNVKTGHETDVETEQIQEYLKRKMFLSRIDNLENDWLAGEFLPRFQGSRIEFGPFFNYFNREPDFIYGAYFQYKNAKYYNYKWNRNISAGIDYNRYKRQDWVLAELNLSWSYFIQLKSQLDFGFKYVPGIALNNLEDVGPLNHGLIPYVGYYSQINEKTRINLSLALRISEDETLMLPGPEFSLSIYRSRY